MSRKKEDRCRVWGYLEAGEIVLCKLGIATVVTARREDVQPGYAPVILCNRPKNVDPDSFKSFPIDDIHRKIKTWRGFNAGESVIHPTFDNGEEKERLSVVTPAFKAHEVPGCVPVMLNFTDKPIVKWVPADDLKKIYR